MAFSKEAGYQPDMDNHDEHGPIPTEKEIRDLKENPEKPQSPHRKKITRLVLAGLGALGLSMAGMRDASASNIDEAARRSMKTGVNQPFNTDGGNPVDPENPQQGSVEIPPNPEGETAADKAFKLLPTPLKERTKLPKSDPMHLDFAADKNGYVNDKGLPWRSNASPSKPGNVEGEREYADLEEGFMTETDRKTITINKDGQSISVTYILEANVEKGIGIRKYKNVTFSKEFITETTEFMTKFVGPESNGRQFRFVYVPGYHEGFVDFSSNFVRVVATTGGKVIVALERQELNDEVIMYLYTPGTPDSNWSKASDTKTVSSTLSRAMTGAYFPQFMRDPEVDFLRPEAREKYNTLNARGEGISSSSKFALLVDLSTTPPSPRPEQLKK